MEGELKSRFIELYPPHACPICQTEHVAIPSISMTVKTEEGEVQVPFIPFELIGVAEGSTRPGREAGAVDPAAPSPADAEKPLDTPVHAYGLLWATPRATQPQHQSLLFMN